MRARISLSLLLLLVSSFVLASCSVDSTPGKKAEPALLEHVAGADSTLQRFSEAMAAGDSATLASLAGEHFALVADGRTYDLDATIATLRGVLAQGHVSRTLGRITTHVKGRVAWSHYPVAAELTGKGAPVAFNRLETAVLERDSDEQWQVVLMTSMPEAAPH